MAYKLDIIDKKVLYELDKNCRTTDSQLAKKVKRSREAIRMRVKKLVDNNIIQSFTTSINHSKCGFMLFKMYFQLANIPDERERFHIFIKNLSGIYWFGGNDGMWDLHLTFYSKSVQEFDKIKNKIYKEFRHLILKKNIGILVEARQYIKKYLVEDLKERPEPSIYGGNIIPYELSPLDKEIIQLLIKNARISLIELARRTGSTIDIIRNRIRKMEEKGIIIQYKISINYTKLGYEMFKAFIYINYLSEKDEWKLIEYAKQHSKIMYLIKQLSAWDIEIEIVANDYQDFTEIMNEIRLEFANVIRNYEFVVMREDIWTFGEQELF